MHFYSADGSSGSQTLNRIGTTVDGWQTYRLRGTPLSGIFEDLTFYLQGGDFRIGPFEIHVVDEPVVESTALACEFPDYMVDVQSGRWTPRSIALAGRTPLPKGTRVTINAQTNRPLKKVYAIDQTNGETTNVELSDDGFSMGIEALDESQDFLFYMVDQLGVVSEVPHRVTLDAVDDQAPEVEGMLAGIGSAITPMAVLPVRGDVKDDYDVDSVWIEIDTPVTDTIRQDVPTTAGGVAEVEFDLRDYAQQNSNFVLPDQNAEITVVLKAADRMDLGDGANVGIGDEYTLELVSSDVLLKLLEQLEVGQRKRLEQIFNEVSDVREYLVRTKLPVAASEGDQVVLEPGESDVAQRQQQNDLRTLFAQRAILQIDKSGREISGVADAFDDIRMQLINNRVDSEDRKIRLAKQIIAPLQAIPDGVLAELRTSVVQLDEALQQVDKQEPDEAQAALATASSILLTDQALAELDGILSILVKYETQNELLDIVRRMIAEQETLLDEVKKLRQREAFDDLFE